MCECVRAGVSDRKRCSQLSLTNLFLSHTLTLSLSLTHSVGLLTRGPSVRIAHQPRDTVIVPESPPLPGEAVSAGEPVPAASLGSEEPHNQPSAAKRPLEAATMIRTASKTACGRESEAEPTAGQQEAAGAANRQAGAAAPAEPEPPAS